VTDATGGGSSRWKTFGERVIYDNPWVWLGQVDVELPDGERFWHHVVRLHRAAMMVLLDDQDRVLLLWRHRFVQDRWGWELPGGLIDEGEEPAETAARELEEETGYLAARVEHLITFQPIVGMVDSEHVVFTGRDAEKIGEPTEGNEARNELKPPAAFRIPASSVKLRHLRAAAIGHLHTDKTVPRADRDCDRPARSPRPAMPDTIAEQLADQQGGVIPAWVPGTSTPTANARATRARSARPATVTLSRISGPAISAPAFPGRPPPADHRGRRAVCTGMQARLSGSRQAGTRGRRGLSVAVRGKPTVRTDRPGGRTPSAICPWTPRHSDLQRYKVTHDGTEEKRPA
jgi:8-oxo-dGTP pyrophosphatase MutT (NUDIX family)